VFCTNPSHAHCPSKLYKQIQFPRFPDLSSAGRNILLIIIIIIIIIIMRLMFVPATAP
jgi:hypothetical protein